MFSFNTSAMRIRMDSCSFGTVIFVCILTSVLSEDHCNLIFNMGKYKPFLFHMFVFTVFQFCICTFMHLCISFYPMFILFVIMNYLHVIEIYLCRKCTCSFPCILHHEDLWKYSCNLTNHCKFTPPINILHDTSSWIRTHDFINS